MMKYIRSLIGLALLVFGTGSLADVADAEELRYYIQQFIDEQESVFQTAEPMATSTDEGFLNDMRGWIDGTELRLSADNDDDSKRSIALRVKLKSAPQRSVEQDILQLMRQQHELSRQQVLNSRLQTAYSQLFQLIAEQEQLEHLQLESALQSSAITYYREQVQSSDFHPENLLDSELEHEQLRFQIELQVRRINALAKSINFHATVPSLGLTEAMMLELVSRLDSQTSIEVERAQLDLLLQQKKLRHEQSSQQFALTAVQLSQDYIQEKDSVTGIRVDLQIPFSGPAYNSSVRQQDVSEATYRLHQLNQSETLKASQLVRKMEQKQVAILASERLAKNIDKRIRSATNARLILKLRQQHLQQLKNIMLIRQDMRTLYIELLAHYSLLGRQLDTNWLLPPSAPVSRG
mgnify:CR=1 FL=1